MIVNGREIAREIEDRLKETFSHQEGDVHIDFLSFGDDPSTRSFLNIKKRVANRIGVSLHIHELPENTLESVAEKILHSLAEGQSDGVVVQLPLPKHFNRDTFLNLVPREKDIDCVSPNTLELYKENKSLFVPPVAAAVEEILSRNSIDLSNKRIAIVGYGSLVGKPVSLLMESKGVAFEIFNRDSNLTHLKEFDLIVTGVGKSGLIENDMVKEGVVLIDAGTSESAGGVSGDVDKDTYEKASLVTPVPGGVGPITVVKLFENVAKSIEERSKKQ